MVRKLHDELIKLSTEIITAREDKDLIALYDKAKEVYEKLAVLKFIDEKLNDIEVDVSKNVLATRFEKMANMVMSGNTSVPENNPHDEDIITPGMDTIKDMVSEMPTETEMEHIFGDFVAKSDAIQSDMEVLYPESKKAATAIRPKDFDDRPFKELQIGLNDRIAFVKYLFDGNVDEYNHTLKQLNGINTLKDSLYFIRYILKPEYNNWEGKEDYESRFTALIERRFA